MPFEQGFGVKLYSADFNTFGASEVTQLARFGYKTACLTKVWRTDEDLVGGSRFGRYLRDSINRA